MRLATYGQVSLSTDSHITIKTAPSAAKSAWARSAPLSRAAASSAFRAETRANINSSHTNHPARRVPGSQRPTRPTTRACCANPPFVFHDDRGDHAAPARPPAPPGPAGRRPAAARPTYLAVWCDLRARTRARARCLCVEGTWYWRRATRPDARIRGPVRPLTAARELVGPGIRDSRTGARRWRGPFLLPWSWKGAVISRRE